MVRDFRGRDGQDGWIFSIRRDGAVADPRRDFYAHTFVLLAIASYVEATGKQQALALADETLAFVDRHLRAAARRAASSKACRSADGLRRQNPHMHMFEGLLSLWECSREARYLTRAGELFDLFAVALLPCRVPAFWASTSRPPCSLPRASPAASSSPAIITSGSGCSGASEQITGRPVQPYVDALYDFADRHGFDGAGLIVDELLVDGSHHAPSRRIWPVAEAVKANLVEARLGRPGAADKAASLAALLKDSLPDRRSARRLARRLDHTRRLPQQVHARQHLVPRRLRDR